jgi:hypothetical protein
MSKDTPNSPRGQHNLLAYIIVLLLGGTAGGGVSLLSPDPGAHDHPEISVLEARMDILWEAEKSRVARQLGDMR